MTVLTLLQCFCDVFSSSRDFPYNEFSEYFVKYSRALRLDENGNEVSVGPTEEIQEQVFFFFFGGIWIFNFIIFFHWVG